jgi:uncharacterized protein YciI
MYVVLLRYPTPGADEPHRAAHRAFIARAVEQGRILVSGPMEPRTGGVIVTTASTRAEVEALIAEDPYHQAGVASHEPIQFIALNGTASSVLETRA